MVIGGETANSSFTELSAAAKEIAELKAKVTKLERLVDGILAQHLAGAEPATFVTADDRVDNDDVTTFVEAADAETHAHVESDETCGDCTCQSGGACSKIGSDHDVAPEQHPPTSGSLPAAVLSLICQPTKKALTSTDDLTLIKGIDCATALELAAQDLSRFSDIADLNADAVETLKKTVAASAQIHKQGWIEQAAILADGKFTAHAADVLAEHAEDQTCEAELVHEDIAHETAEQEIADVDVLTTPTTPDVPVLDMPALDVPVSEIEVEDPFITLDSKIDTAETTLQDIALQNPPRDISISWSAAHLAPSHDSTISFLPMTAVDSGFAVEKIAHVAPKTIKDSGNLHALTTSIAATAILVVASSAAGLIQFDANMAQLTTTDLCQMSGLSAFPDACKHVLGGVL